MTLTRYFFRKLGHASVIAQLAAIIHDDDGFCSRRDEALGFIEIDGQRSVIDIAEDWRRARRQNCLEVGHIVERRRNDFVSRPGAGDQQGKVQRRMAGAHCGYEPVSHTQIMPRGIFKVSDVAAHAQPAEFESLPARRVLGFFDQRFEDRYSRVGIDSRRSPGDILTRGHGHRRWLRSRSERIGGFTGHSIAKAGSSQRTPRAQFSA